MKQLLLFTFSVISLAAHAQCVEKVNTNNEGNTEEPVDNSPVSYNKMERGEDFSGDYAIKGLKIGGGISTGLFYSGIGRRMEDMRGGISQDAHWNHNKTGGFLDVMYQLNTKRNVSFGFSTTWNPLWNQKESFVTEPVYSQPATPPFGPQTAPESLYALRWNTKKELKLNNFLFFSDIEFLRLNKKFLLFVRPEIGISNYRSVLTIKAQDTCGCDFTAYHTNDRKTALTGGLGLGLNFQHAFLEIKSLLGYRVYNMIGMASRDDFSQWRAAFDQASYDFKGGKPSADLFSIEKPENAPQIGRRTGVFYFQLGVYLNLGQLLN